ncbi:hypothetical protein JY651_44660 [Pyxidicoccus parkwayensis]|uniref:MYXO-CTERM domain-containing protein n=1 Tax=Pyxidicoccus parkwayensis TaxID=2813578 RepID=A0ABX7NUJ5_9BACT|nr:hypothetical protein [Pyxidicoccus parkwaysis]QSQ22153.1 hypothetical protein JY651_44660 [Pyxidicoccus parkwaysis]
MIGPLSFHCVRARMMCLAGWLVLLVLLSVSSAFAGDTGELDTVILTGPDSFTTSTTADFTFRSTLINRTAEFWCSLDDETYAPCNDGTWHREGITPGLHLFWVYAYDRLMDRVDSTPANWEWVVEEAQPPLDAGSPGDAGSGDTDGGVPPADAGSGADAGSPGSDAGSGNNDGGSPASDAGTSVDGGSTGSDAGSGNNDAGTPPRDAGSGNDGGSTGTDAGSSGEHDGGSSGDVDGGTGPTDDGGTGNTHDGGTPGTDAGAPGEDGGTPAPVPPGDTKPPNALDYLGSGMGCTGAPAPGAMTGLLLLMLALRRRKRR